MSGDFEKFKIFWPLAIAHNSKGNASKEVRYQVGTERLNFLKQHCRPFAYGITEGVESFAFLAALEEEDLDPRMGAGIRFEYVCGRIVGNECIFFAYAWFDSLIEAIKYAKSHRMTIDEGWR